MTTLAVSSLRQLERSSIRAFVIEHANLLAGHVLDLGCGKQPYRNIVEAAGGDYVGYDRKGFPANVSDSDRGPDAPLRHQWDAILCTQVIQYVANPGDFLANIRRALKRDGALVMTGPTNWPVVEREDRWRFTPTGIASLLNNTGFLVETVEERATVEFEGESWLLGWGVVAR